MDLKSSWAVLESFRTLEGRRLFEESELVSVCGVARDGSAERVGSFGPTVEELPTLGCLTIPKFLALVNRSPLSARVCLTLTSYEAEDSMI